MKCGFLPLIGLGLFLSVGCAASGARAARPSLPEVSELPARKGLPDPLETLDGRKVTSRRQWEAERRPELRTLFQHYMYGYFPDAPGNVKGAMMRMDPRSFGGKATLKE